MLFNVTGSGGNPVNFRVVGGTTQPTSPKENTIWVKTGIAIPAIYLNKGPKPTWANPKGTVAISYEPIHGSGNITPTTATLNLIKYGAGGIGGIYAMLNACYQNQDGTAAGWAQMDAYIYKSGKWVQFSATFDGYLFNYGSVNTEVTGGWKSDGDGPVEAQSDGSVVVKPKTNYSEGIYHTVNKISLSGYSKLTMNGRLWETEGTYRAHICVWSEVTYGDYDQGLVASFTNADLRISSDKDYILDVSGLTGSYYIGVAVTEHPNYATIYMNTMKLT